MISFSWHSSCYLGYRLHKDDPDKFAQKGSRAFREDGERNVKSKDLTPETQKPGEGIQGTEECVGTRPGDKMNYVEILGFTAATLTTSSFLPQVIKIWKTRSTKDISLSMYAVLSLGIFLWLLYGVFIRSWPVIGANAICFVLCITILAFKIRYG